MTPACNAPLQAQRTTREEEQAIAFTWSTLRSIFNNSTLPPIYKEASKGVSTLGVADVPLPRLRRGRRTPLPLPPTAGLREAVSLGLLRYAFGFPRPWRLRPTVQAAPHVGEGRTRSTVQPPDPNAGQAGQARQVLEPAGLSPAVVDATVQDDELSQGAGPSDLLAHLQYQVDGVRHVHRLQVMEALQHRGLDSCQALQIQLECAHACELQQSRWNPAGTAEGALYGQAVQARQYEGVGGWQRGFRPAPIAPGMCGEM